LPEERLRILVIDDDGDLTASVAAVLASSGYEVLTATSGEQGLELAYTGHPHLILLDVTMPGMDGHQVCRELQFGYTKDIPVVFLTARTELAHMMEANRSGASAYITKPFQNEHLLRTISDVLRDSSVYHDDITGLPTLANVQVEVQRMLFDHGQLGVRSSTMCTASSARASSSRAAS
jgi:DNA-binding response OmpR family regulator